MSPSTTQLQTTTALLIGALVVWRVYARIRRLVGRQRFKAPRAWLTALLFPLLLLLLLTLSSLAHPLHALVLAGGAAAGVGLALYGLRQTRFEATPEGRFYTPDARIGIALSALLIVRLAYRLVQSHLLSSDAPVAIKASSWTGPPEFLVGSPLTLCFVGLVCGYYACYAVGLLRWARGVPALR